MQLISPSWTVGLMNLSYQSEDTSETTTSFKVYDRENLSCYDCDNLITRVKQSGRSTYYCGKCQS